MEEMATLLGNPEQAYPVIHITGTNGKGSTSTIATALLVAMGLSVGTYTSPNLENVAERIALGGLPIDDAPFTEALDRLRLLDGLLQESPTRFELLTMAAFGAFADAAVDVAVVEVGLGGSWDSTNIASGQVSVITNVGLDHMEVLGDTVEAIAADKAGIVKPGSTAVLGDLQPSVRAIVERRAAEVGAGPVLMANRDFAVTRNDVAVGGRVMDVTTPYGSYEDLYLGLNGAHQAANAAVAIVAVEAFFGRTLPDEVVEATLDRVKMPARLEVMGRNPLVMLDGAHNVHGATALAEALREGFSVSGSTTLVTGMLRGRDPVAMLSALSTIGIDRVIACSPVTPRAMDAAEVAQAATSLGLTVEVAPSIEEACERAVSSAAADDLIVVAGSLYLAGAARSTLARLCQGA
jgi:dihydrofolate synthase/folylpolyglutamate synthase